MWCGRLARKCLDELKQGLRTGRPHHMSFGTVSLQTAYRSPHLTKVILSINQVVLLIPGNSTFS